MIFFLKLHLEIFFPLDKLLSIKNISLKFIIQNHILPCSWLKKVFIHQKNFKKKNEIYLVF